MDHFTQYVGSSPYGSPAVLCGIAHMQTRRGRLVSDGRHARRAGRAGKTRARTRRGDSAPNTQIEKILTQGGAVTGVRTNHGEEIPLRAVVSNCDSVRTHRELINGSVGAKFEKRRSYEAACSGVVLYLGLNKRYEHLAHHDFVFSRDPHEEFDFIYKKGEPAPDPTCYLAATTCTEPATAPAGGEALYVLVHTPYLRPHHDWKKMLPAYRKVIIEKLKRTGGMPDIEERIVFERTLTPQDINDRYHVLNGAIYGLASHGRFLGAFKPGNRSPDLRGLYLAGGAAHPGPGMPMVLMSGWIAADALDKDGVVGTVRERSADCPSRSPQNWSKHDEHEHTCKAARRSRVRQVMDCASPLALWRRLRHRPRLKAATDCHTPRRCRGFPARFSAGSPGIRAATCAGTSTPAGLAPGLPPDLGAAAGHLLQPRFVVGRAGLPRAEGRILSRPHGLRAD